MIDNSLYFLKPITDMLADKSIQICIYFLRAFKKKKKSHH